MEALCIMIEDTMKYSDLSKEMVINLMEFAQKMSVKNLALLLDKKTRDYVKILQGMMTVGFENDTQQKVVKVLNKDYKLLKMSLPTVSEQIEEIAF